MDIKGAKKTKSSDFKVIMRNRKRIFTSNIMYFTGGGLELRGFLRFPKLLRRLVRVFLLPYAIIRSVHLISRPLVFRQISFIITTKCTLRCEKCANLLPFYLTPDRESLPIEHCIDVFDKLFAAIDKVYELNVIGGEPFLHEGLAPLLEHIVKQPKLKIISITTNGTMLPTMDAVKRLRHSKIVVNISDYGNHTNKKSELASVLENNGIHYSINTIDQWIDYGDMNPRNRDFNHLCKVFYSCRNPACISIWNGKLHQCPRSAHGIDLGLIPDTPRDYVDIASGDAENTRRQIQEFRLKTKTIAACDYCDSSKVIPRKSIVPGKQIEKGAERKL